MAADDDDGSTWRLRARVSENERGKRFECAHRYIVVRYRRLRPVGGTIINEFFFFPRFKTVIVCPRTHTFRYVYHSRACAQFLAVFTKKGTFSYPLLWPQVFVFRENSDRLCSTRNYVF